jgi:hypothetical protein
MQRARITLVVLLRIGGFGAAAGIFFVFVPFDWMQDIARWLTLAEPAATPLNHYLTRSLSAMYAFHGALLLYLSLDAIRYAPLVRFLAGLGIAFGALLFGLDYLVGMPRLWTFCEGPFVAIYSAALYAAADRVCRRHDEGLIAGDAHNAR